jgi:hypothetical protein
MDTFPFISNTSPQAKAYIYIYILGTNEKKGPITSPPRSNQIGGRNHFVGGGGFFKNLQFLYLVFSFLISSLGKQDKKEQSLNK